MDSRGDCSSRASWCSVFECVNQAFEEQAAVGAAKDRFASAFGMRHEPSHITTFVAKAGDVLQRAVGIRLIIWFAGRIDVLPQNAISGAKRGERFRVGEVAAFAMSDGEPQQLSGRYLAGER